MENLCHRCGATIAEDAPFCSQCGAPQIRVQPPIQEPNPAELSSQQAAQTLSPPALYNSNDLVWKYAFPAAVKAGLAMSIATIFLARVFPLWMIAGGWLAVTLYRRRIYGREIAFAQGAKLGAVAGLLGFAFFSLIAALWFAVATFILHEGPQFRSLMRTAVQQAAASNPDPRMQQMVQWMQTPEGLVVLVVVSLILFFLAYLLLSSFGGMLGTALGRKRSS